MIMPADDNKTGQPFNEGRVSDGGKVSTPERVGSVRDARTIYDGLKLYQNERGADYARIRGQRDGNPIYSDKTLTQLGQAWRWNGNTLQHEAVMDQNIDGFWMLGNDVDNVITTKCHYNDPQITNKEVATIIDEEYTRIWREWTDRVFLEQLMLDQMLEFGHTAARFSDQWDWRFEVVRSGCIVYPRNTQAAPGKIKFAQETGVIEPSTLLRLFSDPNGKLTDEEMQKAMRDEGWNLEVAKLVLEKHFKDPNANKDEAGISLFEYIQRTFKNNDAAMGESHFKDINAAWHYVKEWDGKATVYVFATDITDGDDFLFKKRDIADSMERVWIPLFYNYGDGMARTVRGIGHRIFRHCEWSDRAIGMAFDAGMFNASMVVRQKSASAVGKSPLQRLGPITVLEQDFDPVQQQYMPRFDALIGLRQVMQQIMGNNAPNFRPRMESGDETQKSATQSRLESQQDSKVTVSKSALFYAQYDILHREVLRRLINPDYASHAPGYAEHKKFRARLKRRGVPDAALDLDEHLSVRATRAVGLGSISERDRNSRELVSLVGLLPGEGQHEAVRSRVSFLVGTENADRFIPASPSALAITSETSLATLENLAMEGGRLIPVGAGQPVPIHMKAHLPPLVELSLRFREQSQTINLQSAVPYFAAAIAHMRAHVDVLRPVKQYAGMVKAFDAQLAELESALKRMAAMRDEQAQAQQQAQSQQMQQQATNDETLRGLQLEMADFRQKLTLREVKTERDIALKDRKFEAAEAREQARFEAEQARSNGQPAGV